MTFDKQNNGHIAKPFTPTLSTSFNRANKSPLTPKLANPSSVRVPKRLATLDHPATTPARQGPVPSYLNTNVTPHVNVTPRSGSRSSRRDGPILSPGRTPANGLHSPQSSFVQPSPVAGPNTKLYRTDHSPVRIGAKLETPRNARAKTLTSDLNTTSRPPSTEPLASSPMFFHASDARSVSSSSDADVRSRVSGKLASPPTFVYANGKEESQAPVDDTTAVRRLSGLSRPAAVPRPTTLPRIKSPKLNASSPRFSDSIPSPGLPHLDDSPEIRSPVHSPPLSTVQPVPMIRHTKSSSLDTGRGTPHREMYPERLRPSPVIVSALDSQVEEDNVSEAVPALRPRLFSDGSTNSFDSQGDGLQSPVKSEHAGSGPVLSARVERKILDLEISNSSLLAINRTLEREMRKQNAELRRFRRLSRSGRLSMAPSRSVSSTFSIPSEIDEGESDLSSNQSHDSLSDELSDEEESMLDEGSLDPDSVAADDTRPRNKDEKRFLIDLTKHQELLADSQKMNQSLKRCLGWTEELINEARKALEYNVTVSDIQLGGRVLSPDELIEDGEARRGLLAIEPKLPNMDPPGEDSLST